MIGQCKLSYVGKNSYDTNVTMDIRPAIEIIVLEGLDCIYQTDSSMKAQVRSINAAPN